MSTIIANKTKSTRTACVARSRPAGSSTRRTGHSGTHSAGTTAWAKWLGAPAGRDPLSGARTHTGSCNCKIHRIFYIANAAFSHILTL